MSDQNPEIPEIGEAEYLLESPLKCAHCSELISSVQVVRLLRTRVNFTSSLPRRGYAVVCPRCTGILTVGLGGLP